MSERPSPIHLECPFVDTCNAAIDSQQQFDAYCNEMIINPKDPNFLVCPAYQKLQKSPRMWKARMQGKMDDSGYSSSRTRGGR